MSLNIIVYPVFCHFKVYFLFIATSTRLETGGSGAHEKEQEFSRVFNAVSEL